MIAMTFSEAVTAIASGKKVNRKSYSNTSYYEKNKSDDTITVCAMGSEHLFVPTLADFMANDWYIVEEVIL